MRRNLGDRCNVSVMTCSACASKCFRADEASVEQVASGLVGRKQAQAQT